MRARSHVDITRTERVLLEFAGMHGIAIGIFWISVAMRNGVSHTGDSLNMISQLITRVLSKEKGNNRSSQTFAKMDDSLIRTTRPSCRGVEQGRWMKSAMILAAAVMSLHSLSSFADTISEETPPTSCGNKLVFGIKCSGRYCDNITPVCGFTTYKIYDVKWTKFVSEERGGTISCNVPNPSEKEHGNWGAGEPAFIIGFSCKGRYCDNVALECAALKNAYTNAQSARKGCRWTRWTSEEQPPLYFPYHLAAISMQCRGRYCDDKRFLLCPIGAVPIAEW